MSQQFTPEQFKALSALANGLIAGMGGAGGGSSSGGSSEASDAELDGQYGDPEVKKDPKRWAGESHVGRTYSQSDPEFLITLAEFNEWIVSKDRNNPEAKKHKNGTPYWKYSECDAQLARGWARRLRAGGTAKPRPAQRAPAPIPEELADSGPADTGYGPEFEGDDSIPF